MAKTLSLVFGIVFVLVGLLGFIGNPIVGMDAIFHTDSVHNVIHLLLGLVLIWTGTKGAANAGMALKVVGVIYLVVAVLGWMGGDSILGLFEINGADNWLHLVLGLVLVWAGWGGKKSMPMTSMPGQM